MKPLHGIHVPIFPPTRGVYVLFPLTSGVTLPIGRRAFRSRSLPSYGQDSPQPQGKHNQMCDSTYSKTTCLSPSPPRAYYPSKPQRNRAKGPADLQAPLSAGLKQGNALRASLPTHSPLRPPWCGLSLHTGTLSSHPSSDSSGTVHLSSSSRAQRPPRNKPSIPLQPSPLSFFSV